MINKNHTIRMTASEYVPQFYWKACKYYHADFYTSTVHVKKMFLNKYAIKDYAGTLHAFKVKLC